MRFSLIKAAEGARCVEGESAKIQIARDDDTCVGECGFKNSAVRGTGHTDVRDTNDIVTCGTKELDGNGENVMIDQQAHLAVSSGCVHFVATR